MDKKIIVLLSGCILAVFLLAGCGNDEVSSEYNIEYLNKDKTKIAEMPYERRGFGYRWDDQRIFSKVKLRF